MMVGTTRKSSPLDRMWTSLVTCGVSREDDDVIHSQKEGVYSKKPKENMQPEADATEGVASEQKLPTDDTTPTPITSTSTTCCQSPPIPTETSNSKWHRLRRMLRIPKSRKRKQSTNGQVIKLRNGCTVTVPDIVITAPDDDDEEEVVVVEGEPEDIMAAKMADPVQTVDIEMTLEE